MHKNQNNEPHNPTQPQWIEGAYNPEAARLLSGLRSMESQVQQAVGRFYNSLLIHPVARKVLENLDEAELQHLVDAQCHYLQNVLSPQLSAEQHYQMAAAAGLRHVAVGLPVGTLAESESLYHAMATALVAHHPEAEPCRAVINTRLQYDLICQIKAYTREQNDQLAIYTRIEQHLADSPLDWLQSALEILLKGMEAMIVGVALGRVKNHTYRHLLAQGKVPWQGDESPASGYPIKVTPEFQQAWMDEQALMANNLHQDTPLPASFREECRLLGVRSAALFIAHGPQGVPQSLLLVSGRFPGYFLVEENQKFLAKNSRPDRSEPGQGRAWAAPAHASTERWTALSSVTGSR